MMTTDVRPANDRDQAVVVGVITLAFSTDPMARWSFPDPATYLTAMTEFVPAFGGRGFAHGTVHVIDGGLGAAMWLPPDVHPDSDRLMAISEQYVPNQNLPDMMKVFEQMEAYHPSEPCWYLPLIGVDPSCQGRGYGSALLKYALEQCDRDGTVAYLESTSEKNIPLYERHGFEILGRIQVGTSPTLTPMLRRPR